MEQYHDKHVTLPQDITRIKQLYPVAIVLN